MLGILGRSANVAENSRVVTHQLINRVAGQFGVFGEQRLLVVVGAQRLHRRGQLIACGVGTGPQIAIGAWTRRPR